MKSFFITATLMTIVIGPPVFASGGGAIVGGTIKEGSGVGVNNSNSSQSSQHSSGIINQSPVGGINQNTQYNESTSTDNGFGGGVYCRGATLNLAGYGGTASGFGHSASSYGGVVGISIPLNGAVIETCKALAREITLQRQLDTCLTVLKAGVTFDPAVWPELSRCSSLGMAARPAVVVPPPASAEVSVPRPTDRPRTPRRPRTPIRGKG